MSTREARKAGAVAVVRFRGAAAACRGVLGGAAVLLGACATPLGVDDELLPLLRTDAVAYVVTIRHPLVRLRVPYAFTNHTTVTVYVGGCNGVISPAFDRWDGIGWTHVYTQPFDDCGPSPVPIPPGGILRDTADIVWSRESDPGTAAPYPRATVVGAYRLRWWQAGIVPFSGVPTAGSDALPQELAVSNTFQILEPPPRTPR